MFSIKGLKMTKRYSGIGSRTAPLEVLNKAIQLGKELASKGYILHSGGADGMDSAFEEGCDLVNGQKQIFLPWKNFNKNPSKLYNPPEEAMKMAEQLHPAWFACSYGAKKLHARNIQQVLGEKLDTPVDFVVCWTLSGSLSGGTATAMKLATLNNIPVYNLAVPEDCVKLDEELLKSCT